MKTYYAVMLLSKWEDVRLMDDIPLLNNIHLTTTPDQPQYYIAVFESYLEAVKWGGSEDLVMELKDREIDKAKELPRA